MVPTLRGRAEEQARLERLLAQAREGASGVLVVRGEPGIGKTALLDHAASSPHGMRVIRGTAVESEAELPFAGLHLLFGAALDVLPALPGPQAAALRGAFGLGPATGDRFLIGLGVLSLLAELAGDGSLVCLVDDAHWLDHASADALLIAARRLEAEGVALIFAARSPGFPAPGLAETVLDRLDDAAASALLAHVPLPDEVRRRVLTSAAGNPLALIELSHADWEPDPVEVPLTDRLQRAFLHRAAALPENGRTLLAAAAAERAADLPTLLDATKGLGVTAADVEPACGSGLVVQSAGRLEFRHPLMRAAVYQGTPLPLRLAVHAALAESLPGPGNADRRAWHRAAAATAPDERLADELEHTAVRASNRNGFAAAAAAYKRAAELGTDLGARARRLTLAAEATEYSGRFDEARRIAEQAGGQCTDPGLISRLVRVRACSDYGQGLLPSAHALLCVGVSHVIDSNPQDAAGLLLDASSLIWLDGDRDMAVRTAAQLAELRLPPGDPMTAVYHLCRWFAALALRKPVTGLPPLPGVVAHAREPAGIDRRGLLLLAGLGLAEPDANTHDLAVSAVAAIREENRIGLLPQALTYLAAVQLSLGWHADARAHANEAAHIAAGTAQPQWTRQAQALLAQLAAIEGDSAGCADFPEARALLDLGLGRTETALVALENLVYGRAHNQIPAMRRVPDLVESAVRCGRPARAGEPLARFEEWAALLDQRWAHALTARCRALLTPGDEAFTTALDLHEPSRPFERARTELLYGEWLRRARRRVDARARLTAALETFTRLGSTPWATRARTELGAAGVSPSPIDGHDPLSGLTPQERQIIQLAARGLTNKDIAAQLFLSPRTVGQHLYKAFPKLGVTSRAELPALTS
ncbi:AAA family ATPase [Nonomuraea sp. JJY05]|uniref:helix-turn-helix transcriptional regulator n=1 Tax=Nonomuraea sp. JJY05 TaxID=3350255 RepID=UPI00373F56A9